MVKKHEPQRRLARTLIVDNSVTLGAEIIFYFENIKTMGERMMKNLWLISTLAAIARVQRVQKENVKKPIMLNAFKER